MSELFKSFQQKQKDILAIFTPLKTKEERYQKIIELGRLLPPFPEDQKVDANLVKGCQSRLFLFAVCGEGKVYFKAFSDALISSGLAYLVLYIYNGETPEVILKCDPDVLSQLEIPEHLTPGRAHGLHSLITQMKQNALSFLMSN